MANPTTNLQMTLPIGEGSPSKVQDYNAALQILDALFAAGVAAAWASWTPTWTNLTLGNGVVEAKYARVGKLVFCRLSIVFGTTTSVSGDIQFSLPVTRATYGGSAAVGALGVASVYDASATTTYESTVVKLTTTVSRFLFGLASGTYVTKTIASSTVPFTWATSDEIHAEFFYEGA